MRMPAKCGPLRTYPLGGSHRRYCITTHSDRAWTNKGVKSTHHVVTTSLSGAVQLLAIGDQTLVQVKFGEREDWTLCRIGIAASLGWP